jgi:NADPH:quinone reductase-like Zn-dependent oxidoreductase
VAAVSVNPVDTKQRPRQQIEAQPRVLGWDAANGRAAGPEVTLLNLATRSTTRARYATRLNSELNLVDGASSRSSRTMDFARAAAIHDRNHGVEAYFDRMKIDQASAS